MNVKAYVVTTIFIVFSISACNESCEQQRREPELDSEQTDPPIVGETINPRMQGRSSYLFEARDNPSSRQLSQHYRTPNSAANDPVASEFFVKNQGSRLKDPSLAGLNDVMNGANKTTENYRSIVRGLKFPKDLSSPMEYINKAVYEMQLIIDKKPSEETLSSIPKTLDRLRTDLIGLIMEASKKVLEFVKNEVAADVDYHISTFLQPYLEALKDLKADEATKNSVVDMMDELRRLKETRKKYGNSSYSGGGANENREDASGSSSSKQGGAKKQLE